jgi:hypothetical protein
MLNQYGTYTMIGGSVSSEVTRPSPTRPTISNRCSGSARVKRRPMTSSPGQSVFAARSEITAGVTAEARSRSSMLRPCRMGMPIASKYSGPTNL